MLRWKGSILREASHVVVKVMIGEEIEMRLVGNGSCKEHEICKPATASDTGTTPHWMVLRGSACCPLLSDPEQKSSISRIVEERNTGRAGMTVAGYASLVLQNASDAPPDCFAQQGT